MAFLWSVIKPLAYLSFPAIILRSVANSSPAGRYYVRVGVYVLTLTLTGVWGAFVAAGMSLFGHQYDVNYVVARSFYFLAGRVLGIEVVVEGEEYLQTRPAVLMSNHQTMVDVLILGRLMPKGTSIMAKKELQWSPLGAFMTMSGSVFVDRGNNANAVRSMQAAGEGMKTRRTSLWMYPEGTRTSQEEPKVITLKKGGFYMAIQAGIPIVPVITENYWSLYHPHVFDSGTVKVRVLPPVSTEGLTSADAAELATRVRDQMLETLRDISAKVPTSTQRLQKLDSPPLQTTPLPPPPASRIVDPPPSAVNEQPSYNSGAEESTGEGTNDSTSLFSGSESSRRKEGSEYGTETEEEEGMVIVGRPT